MTVSLYIILESCNNDMLLKKSENHKNKIKLIIDIILKE